MIQGPFADILKDQRARFNAQFAEARHFYPLLDAEVFSEHLVETLNPIIQAVAALRPEVAQSIAAALYELSLELVGRELLGRRSRYPAISAGWRGLLPALALPLAEAPTRVAGAVTNALHNLSTTPGARPMEWIDLLLRLTDAPLWRKQCLDVETLLRAGQIAAWRAGMAHYRLSALDLCRNMDPAQVAQLLDLPAPPSDFNAWITRLRADPWLPPALALNPPGRRSIRLVAQVGGFRGYGGPFAVPPIISGAEDTAFLVQEGDRRWRLYADCFGATLLRADPLFTSEMPAAIGQLRLGTGGEVRAGMMERQVFPQLILTSGWAENGSTLAVSTHFSHKITLIAQVAHK